MMTLLTDLGIRRAKPKESVYSLNDGRGLSLRIEPNGAKLWHFRFYWQGKQQRVSFDTRVLIANGIDPRVHQVEDDGSCQGITFAEFAEHWKNFKLKKLGVYTLKNRQSTRVQIERYLRKDLLPVLGAHYL